MRHLVKKILLQKQIQKLSIYGFGQAFNLVTPFLVMPYIISVCGLENYGKVSIALALSFFLLVFIDYGSEIVSVRDVSINRANPVKVSEVFSTTQAAKVIMMLFMTSLCLLFFNAVPYFKENYLLYSLSLTILVGQVLSPVWLLQGLEKYTLITTINICSKLIYVFLVFLFVKNESDFVYINLYWGFGMIISNLAVLLYLHFRYNFKFSKKEFVDGLNYLKINFKLFLSQVSTSLQLYLPLMLVGWFGSNLLAGQFKVVEQIIVVLRTYLLLFFNFIYPNICFKLTDGVKKTIRFWSIANGANLTFILFLSFLIFIFRGKIIQHFSSENVTSLSQLLEIAIIIPIVQAIQIPLKQLVLAFDHTNYYVGTSLLQTILVVGLIIFSVQNFNLDAVIWSIIISETLISFAYLYILSKPPKVPIN